MIKLTDAQKAIEEMYAENKRLKEENEKLRKLKIEAEKYLDADGSINADGIHDAIDELINISR